MKKVIQKHLDLFGIIAVIAALIIIYLCITFGGVYKYLTEYGYGIKELPKTAAVYFNISKGFTVKENDDYTIFIGNHDYIYKDLFAKKGYYEADRLGLVGLYNKSGIDTDPKDFSVFSTDDWCHWFRIYRITGDITIEDFID